MPEAEINGLRLVYDIHGSGEPVVLVCGTGQNASSWGLFHVPALTAAGYSVVTFDNRGIAPSDCPPGPYTVQQMAGDVAGLIEQLGVSGCRVVGYSLGAFMTQELALARPDLIGAAVMLGTFGRKDAFRRALMKAWVELDESGIALPHFYDVVSSSFSLLSSKSLNDETAVTAYIEGSMAMPTWSGPGKVGQHQADLAYEDRLGALAQVQVPCLVIGFEFDMVTPAYLGEEVARAIPGGHYIEVAGAGHAGPFEKADEVNSAILEFFAQNSEGEAQRRA